MDSSVNLFSQIPVAFDLMGMEPKEHEPATWLYNGHVGLLHFDRADWPGSADSCDRIRRVRPSPSLSNGRQNI